MLQQNASTPARDSEKEFELFVSSGTDYGAALTPPPEPITCKHCGKKLYFQGMRNKNGIVSRWLFPEKCECEKAKAERKELDRQYEETRRKKEIEEQNRRRLARIERLIGQSGMGERFKRRTFDTYKCSTDKQRKCFDKAKEYAEHFDEYFRAGKGLFMAGSIGTGKTHLAAAISLSLLSNGVPVIFRTAIDMFLDIKRSFTGEISEIEVVNEYKNAHLLVIDDLGKERMTEWAAATLYGIINARYENMLPTIITTNFTNDDLLRSLGDEPTRAQAILSRLMETSAYISMKWDDYRVGGGENG